MRPNATPNTRHRSLKDRYAISVRANRYWKQLLLNAPELAGLPAGRLGDRQFGMRINPHAPQADLSGPIRAPSSSPRPDGTSVSVA
jgi:hypothetical protein